MRLTSFILASLLMTQAHASTAHLDYEWVKGLDPKSIQTHIKVRKQSIPVLVFDQMTGAPGQTEQSFAKDIAKRLDAFTETTNFEGCGQIHYNSTTQQYAVQLSTNFSQIGCFVPKLNLPGFDEPGASIHSHPHSENFRANAQDITIQRIFGTPLRRIIYSNRTPGFSSTDLMGGRGYLVDQNQVFYHDGQQKVLALGTLTSPPTTETHVDHVSPSTPGP